MRAWPWILACALAPAACVRVPPPAQAREIANYVGLAMLVLLMFFVFKNDLTR